MPSKNLKITLESLAELQSGAIFSRYFPKGSEFTAENIYGPEGKLSGLWEQTWNSPVEMRSNLCTNMGGGVPIAVIDELVRICSTKN